MIAHLNEPFALGCPAVTWFKLQFCKQNLIYPGLKTEHIPKRKEQLLPKVSLNHKLWNKESLSILHLGKHHQGIICLYQEGNPWESLSSALGSLWGWGSAANLFPDIPWDNTNVNSENRSTNLSVHSELALSSLSKKRWVLTPSLPSGCQNPHSLWPDLFRAGQSTGMGTDTSQRCCSFRQFHPIWFSELPKTPS